jgi:hypothetical protein
MITVSHVSLPCTPTRPRHSQDTCSPSHAHGGKTQHRHRPCESGVRPAGRSPHQRPPLSTKRRIDTFHLYIQQRNLEDTSLEYLDLFFDSAIINPNAEAVDLIHLTARYANPREMVLAIGEQVEIVGTCLNGQFLHDEEEDVEVEEEEEKDLIVEGSGNGKSVDWPQDLNKTMLRLELAIDCYTTSEEHIPSTFSTLSTYHTRI